MIIYSQFIFAICFTLGIFLGVLQDLVTKVSLNPIHETLHYSMQSPTALIRNLPEELMSQIIYFLAISYRIVVFLIALYGIFLLQKAIFNRSQSLNQGKKIMIAAFMALFVYYFVGVFIIPKTLLGVHIYYNLFSYAFMNASFMLLSILFMVISPGIFSGSSHKRSRRSHHGGSYNNNYSNNKRRYNSSYDRSRHNASAAVTEKSRM